MKKIVIFYATFGGGHLSAARSIKEHLELNYKDIDVQMIDFWEYINKIINDVTTKVYSEMAKKLPHTWKHLYNRSQSGPLAHLSNASNKLLSLKLNKLIKELKPDLIISTHPFSSSMCAYLKKRHGLNCKLATVMTDYAPHEQWIILHEFVDYFFVATDDMKKQLIEKNIKEDKIYSTGIPLSNKFSLTFNKDEIYENFGLSKDKKTVLFFGGGKFGLGKSNTLKIFKEFVNSSYDFQMIAISGQNEQMKNNFEKIVSEAHKENCIKIIEFSNQIPEIMSISDLVVTKPGGLTTTESLASGLPMIVINPIPGQEEENAEFLVKNNVAIWIKNPDETENVLNTIFSNSLKLEEMKNRAMLLAKKNSTKDICEILLKN